MKKRPAVKFFVLASSLFLLLGSFSMAHAQSETKSPLQISAIQTANVFVGVAHDFSRDIVRPLLAVPAETLNFIVSFRNNTSFSTFTHVSNQAAVASSNIFVNLWNSIFGEEDVPVVVEKKTVTPPPSTPREPVIVTPVPGFPPSSTATTIVKTVSTNSSELASLRNNISSLTSRIYALENRPSTIVNNYVADQTASLGDSISRLITSNNTNVINNITNVGGSSVDQSNMAITGGTITGVNATTTDLNVTGNLSFDGLYGSAGQVLTSQGEGTTPTWETVSGGGSVATSTIRNMFTASSPLAFSTTTGAFSVASGYSIPLTASTTEWTSGYNNRITSVTNSDGTLTISPTTGAVVASRAAITGDVTIALGSNTSVYAGTLPATKGGFGLSQVRTDISTLTVINNQAVTTGWLNFTGGSNNEITGLVAQADGTTVRISKDRSSGNNIQVAFEDGRSTAANRIVGVNGTSRLLTAGQSLTLVYSTAISRWIVAEVNASADEYNFGFVSTGDQTFEGAKTFKSNSIRATMGDARLYDSGNSTSLDWGNRKLFNSSGTEIAGWAAGSSGALYASDGNNSVKLADSSYAINVTSGAVSFNTPSFSSSFGSTAAGYFTGGGGVVSIADDTYAINVTSGASFFQGTGTFSYSGYSATFASSAGAYISDGSNYVYIGYSGYAIDATGAVRVQNGSYAGSFGNGQGGYASDGTNSVYFGDGTYAVNATGNILASGDITGANIFSANYDLESLGASDNRYKENISPIASSTLDKILTLNPVTYNWNQTYLDMYPNTRDASSTKLGFIAQEMELVFPEVVIHKKDGFLAIDYGKLTAALTQGMKEMYAQVQTLNTVFADIGTFLADKVVSIKDATVGILRIGDKICADDVCVTKEQFKQILLNGGGAAITTPVVPTDFVVVEPDNGTTTEPAIIYDPVIESNTETETVVISDPVVDEEPSPEVAPEPAPAPEPASTE